MSDAMLTDSAARLFRDLCTREVTEAAEAGTWPRELWNALTDTGLAAAAQSDTGVGTVDLCALARVLGAYAAPVPLVETWLAQRMLAAANLSAVDGALTIGPVLRRDNLKLERASGGWRLSGSLKRIPWGRDAETLVLIADADDGARTVVVKKPQGWTHDWSYAREPRDAVRFDRLPVSEEDTGKGWNRSELFFNGALFRTQSMAGAMERALELTVAYAKERVQFGRLIGKFQAVQQQISAMASQVAAGSAVAQSAAEANAERLARFEIAAAKARIGEAVAVVAGVAHQVHAAMGFTHEHTLHRSTRRLWAWRDEFGTETEWQAWVGRVAAQLGGEGLWRYVVAASKPDMGAALP
ncbi:MAG TPA: acyl-CoA dehydrogenase [Burkholderiales bacterium]|nr:acyl-CoA dehydrogenase [Burkholderiales bacterium]